METENSTRKTRLVCAEMDEQEFKRTDKKLVTVFWGVILCPAVLLLIYFNFRNVVGIPADVYNVVCLVPKASGMQFVVEILLVLLPKLSGHCAAISFLGRLEMIPSEHGNLIVVLDLAIFSVALLASIYLAVTFNVHRRYLLELYSRRAPDVRYQAARMAVFVIVLTCTCGWFVLFAPIEIPAPTGYFFMTNLMADYGLGVLFYSLCASFLPYSLTSALTIVSTVLGRRRRRKHLTDGA